MTDGAQPTITRITWDLDASETVLTRSDGKEARLPLDPLSWAATSALSKLHYSPMSFDNLTAETRVGDAVLFELPSESGEDQVGARLVVYLDQNQWSAVANAMHNPTKVDPADREAALKLGRWALERRIVLPVSAGHYYETTKTFDTAKRYRLALTMLQLSQGWQMRDPIQVRRDEVHDALACRFRTGATPRTSGVFTLMPDVIHGDWRGAAPYVAPSGFDAKTAFQHRALTSASALIAVMLDDERMDAGSVSGWVRANQEFSDWLDTSGRDGTQKRKSIDAAVVIDLLTEVAEEASAAGVQPDQLKDWLQTDAISDVRTLPATAVWREMLHERHLNTGTAWKPNDLTDMAYLSCATGYADAVVCERHMGSVLAGSVRRLNRRTQVFRRLRDAAPAIESALEAHL